MLTCRFWTFPHDTRYRVAQIVVVPCFQHAGVGSLLLAAVNKVPPSARPRPHAPHPCPVHPAACCFQAD